MLLGLPTFMLLIYGYALNFDVRHVRLAGELRRYVVELVRRTRNAPQVQLGCGPRASIALAVVLADIDHFKSVNDTYGHAAGDAVLHEAAELLRMSARRGDSVCRIGGEEFLVMKESEILAVVG